MIGAGDPAILDKRARWIEQHYPGSFSDQYPSLPDPLRMTVADAQPSAPGAPRRPGPSDTPFNLYRGSDQG